MSLLTLPTDLILLILTHVDLPSLSHLSLTCSAIRSIIEQYGWGNYLRTHPRSSKSLYQAQQSTWSPKYTLRYDALAHINWPKQSFTARPLADPWQIKLHPIIALSNYYLFIAAGAVIEVFIFTGDGKVQFQGYCSLGGGAKGDVTALSVGGDDAEAPLLVGFADGSIEEVALLPPDGHTIPCSRTVPANIGDTSQIWECIQTVSRVPQAQSTLVLAANGTAVIMHDSTVLSTINLLARSWVAHIPPSAAYTAFGTSSSNPLSVHPITPTGFTTIPPTILAAVNQRSMTAVYAVAPFPGHSSDQILVSGWYDGVVRVHDMRSDSMITSDDGSTGLRPVLHAADSWSMLPIYSLSTSPDSPQVAAGMAQHALIAFWDIRYSKADVPKARNGWSMHVPGNDPSPVYSLHMDGSSRLFGVTQSRPFVLDFGPDVEQPTYPPIDLTSRRLRRVRNNNLIEQGAGFYVTKYVHAKKRLDIH